MPDLLTAIRDHLIDGGIARSPRTAGSLPPLRVAEDVPAPGESPSGNATEIGPTTVLGVEYATGLPSRPWEASVRWDGARFVIRTLDTAEALELYARLRGAFLHGAGDHIAGHLGFDMAGLWVIEARQWRALQPLERSPQARTYSCEFLFQTHA